ncbi:MAG: hypothetical protein ACAH11_01915 [Sphingomonas sp.]
MIRHTLFAAGIALMAVANPAPAQTIADFTLNGIAFEVPLPAGMCLPKGQMAEASRRLADADPYNLTLLMVITCGDEAFEHEYLAIKAPYSALSTETERGPFLESLEPMFGTKSSDDLFAGATGIAEKKLEDVTGRPVSIEGKISPLGVDGMCAYLGGVIEVQSDALHYKQAISGCITVVGRKPMIVYSAGRGDSEADVAKHARKARVFAEAIRLKRR